MARQGCSVHGEWIPYCEYCETSGLRAQVAALQRLQEDNASVLRVAQAKNEMLTSQLNTAIGEKEVAWALMKEREVERDGWKAERDMWKERAER